MKFTTFLKHKLTVKFFTLLSTLYTLIIIGHTDPLLFELFWEIQLLVYKQYYLVKRCLSVFPTTVS